MKKHKCKKYTKILMMAGIFLLSFSHADKANAGMLETRDDTCQIAVMGDSISTYQNETPFEMYYYSAANMQLAQTWWKQIEKNNDFELTMNDSCGGSTVTWTEADLEKWSNLADVYSMSSDKRIRDLGTKGDPDIIFFFGGLNDVIASQANPELMGSVSSMVSGKRDDFASAYDTAVEKMQKSYPDAKIVCIIPYYIPAYTTEMSDRAAEIIQYISKKKGCYCVDLRNVIVPSYLIDTVHVNVTGMQNIYYKVQETLEANNLIIHDFEISDKELLVNDGAQGTLSVSYTSMRSQTVIWENENDAVASVVPSQDGKSITIVPKKTGGTMVTVKVGNLEKKCAVFVTESEIKPDTWVLDEDGKICYYNESGEKVSNQFVCDGFYTYYLQEDGTAMRDRLTYHPDGVHLIYFDEYGHECFDKFQYCEDVAYTCYFNTYGYALFNEEVFYHESPYYLDGAGRMVMYEWFTFANGVDRGFADASGCLVNFGFYVDEYGRTIYMNWDGTVARGLIQDADYYYQMDGTDGHLLGKFEKQ